MALGQPRSFSKSNPGEGGDLYKNGPQYSGSRQRLRVAGLIASCAIAAFASGLGHASADDQASPTPAPQTTAPASQPSDCTPPVDPYKNYDCLDAYLGEDVSTRLLNY
ncbi:MAG TPA: hypothetical protein VKR31_00005, partial [Rhizomicrobium sp.]|nr:hypothetical protein [Rhizomicrobium sp.]